MKPSPKYPALPPMPTDLKKEDRKRIDGPPRMCQVCRLVKPVSEYYWNKRQNAYGRLCSHCTMMRYKPPRSERKSPTMMADVGMILKLAREGHPVVSIVERTGYSKVVIYKHLKAHGIRPLKRNSPYPHQRHDDAMVESIGLLYIAGNRVDTIAKMKGLRRAQVAYIIYERYLGRFKLKRDVHDRKDWGPNTTRRMAISARSAQRADEAARSNREKNVRYPESKRLDHNGQAAAK